MADNEETENDFLDHDVELVQNDEIVESLDEQILRHGDQFRVGKDDGLGHWFISTSVQSRIRVIKDLTKLLELLKTYVNLEIEDLNQSHKKIE